MEEISNIPLSLFSEDIASSEPQEMFKHIWKDNSIATLQNFANTSDLENVGENVNLITLNEYLEANLESLGNIENADIISVHEYLEANHHAVVDEIQVPTVGNASQGTSALPACENYPGIYDFDVFFNCQEKNTKGVAWTYSTLKDRLYVLKDALCPFNFSSKRILSNDAYIRVTAQYISPEHASEVVTRCVNHSHEEKENGCFEAEHLIRCESSSAKYHVDPITKRHSVVVKFENPSVGQQYTSYLYKFVCFSSCVGGPNRRPLMLIFTLERNNIILGRKKLNIKICSCPGRDRQTDETNQEPTQHVSVKRKKNPVGVLSNVLQVKKNKVLSNKGGGYVLMTDDKDCYDFLKECKRKYEMDKALKGLSPEKQSKAFQYIQKLKSEKND